jgi:hypothetical protein
MNPGLSGLPGGGSNSVGGVACDAGDAIGKTKGGVGSDAYWFCAKKLSGLAIVEGGGFQPAYPPENEVSVI